MKILAPLNKGSKEVNTKQKGKTNLEGIKLDQQAVDTTFFLCAYFSLEVRKGAQ